MEIDKEGLEKLRELANSGYMSAQYAYALHHYEVREYQVAIEYYFLAASKNYAPAQNNLGWMFRMGHGCRKDASAAYRWFHAAAAQGNTLAVHNLAEMFLYGDGVKKRLEVAEDLLLFGASRDIKSFHSYGQDGCAWAIIECRKELAWMHLEDSYSVGRPHTISAIWANAALIDLAEYWDEQSEYRVKASEALNRLLRQLLTRLSGQERAFFDSVFDKWEEEFASMQDLFGFELAMAGELEDGWLAPELDSPSTQLN